MSEVVESTPPPPIAGVVTPESLFQAPQMAEIVASERDPEALQREKLERIREFEDQMLMRASRIVEDAMSFAEIDEMHPEGMIPREWMEQCGHDRDRAEAKMRVAKAAWKGTRDMPGGIKIAAQVMTSIIKARSLEKQGPKQLNVQLVQISTAMPQFAVLDVEEKGE